MPDEFDLQRFVNAQEPVFERVQQELRDGRKQTHWMWFVFPQIAGLGRSAMAQRYAIGSMAEARAYLAHPLLGSRLVACAELANAAAGRSAHDVFGSPDDMKFHSSMTLFGRAQPGQAAFTAALQRYFAGTEDQATLQRLEGA